MHPPVTPVERRFFNHVSQFIPNSKIKYNFSPKNALLIERERRKHTPLQRIYIYYRGFQRPNAPTITPSVHGECPVFAPCRASAHWFIVRVGAVAAAGVRVPCCSLVVFIFFFPPGICHLLGRSWGSWGSWHASAFHPEDLRGLVPPLLSHFLMEGNRKPQPWYER